MKGRVVAIDTAPDGRTGAALIIDGRLEDLLIDPGDDTPQPEGIFRAQVGRKAGNTGWFVDLGEGGQGYLRENKGVSAGRRLLVQVQGSAEAGKAVPVTARLLFKSRTAIFTPGNPGLNISRQIRDEDERARLLAVAEAVVKEGGATADGEAAPFWEDPGLIIRSAAQGSDPRDLAADVRQVIAEAIRADAVAEPGPARTAPTAAEIAEREWEGRLETGPGAFDHFGVWDAIEALRQSDAALPSGGNLRIEPAAALVAVDVNSGGDFSPAAGLKTNIEAARELPRQLRLRGLGGQVVVDFAPMAKKDRRTLEGAIKAALKRDPVETVAHGWTVMGLFELQRKRERRPLTSLI